jgi:hypothetical protein
MAVHDHTAPARPFFPPTGDAFSHSPAADSTARCSQAPSLRLSTLDDVALALYALAQMCRDDERCRTAKAGQSTATPMARPLPPLFRQGVTVAIQCLEQYARQLGDMRAMNT